MNHNQDNNVNTHQIHSYERTHYTCSIPEIPEREMDEDTGAAVKMFKSVSFTNASGLFTWFNLRTRSFARVTDLLPASSPLPPASMEIRKQGNHAVPRVRQSFGEPYWYTRHLSYSLGAQRHEPHRSVSEIETPAIFKLSHSCHCERRTAENKSIQACSNSSSTCSTRTCCTPTGNWHVRILLVSW